MRPNETRSSEERIAGMEATSWVNCPKTAAPPESCALDRP